MADPVLSCLSCLVWFWFGQDDTFQHLCGVMEYDRTLRVQGDYRAFMFQQARYREVVPLERLGGTPSEVQEVRSGCTVLYRLRYVRDILLHPKIDDPGITAIGSMISFSSAELCAQVRPDRKTGLVV